MNPIYHLREGSGPPLVLIHGIGHHAQAWRPVMDRLADEFYVVACDSPGFGRSAPLPHNVEPTVWAYADAFESFFHEQGLDRPHVAGNSMGGAISLELAQRGVVQSATALSPAGFWTPAERRYAQTSLGVLAKMPGALQGAVLRLAGTKLGRTALLAQLVKRPSTVPYAELADTLRDAFAAPAFVPALKAFDHYDFTLGKELDQSRVTVAWGDADRLLLHGRQAPRARTALPLARHVTLDAGHVPFYDCPDAVADIIRDTATATR